MQLKNSISSLLKTQIRNTSFLQPIAKEAIVRKRSILNSFNELPDLIGWLIDSRSRVECVVVEKKKNLNIALVSHNMSLVREIKIAQAAKLGGFNISLISTIKLPFSNMLEMFDNVFVAQNAWQALKCLKLISPDILHLISPGEDNMLFAQIAKNATIPLIFDPFDCIKGMYTDAYRKSRLETISEKECFARADHICARHLEPRYIKRKYNYTMPKSTYFPEYCGNTPRRRPVRVVGEEEDLHIVYTGGVWPEDKFPADLFGYCQYLEIGKILAAQRIHLHIYPTPVPQSVENFEDFFSLYLKEQDKNKYFHLHRSVPLTQLLKEIEAYDAALHVFGGGVSMPQGKNTQAKIDYSTASKIFNYIEAGLPILIDHGFHQRGIVRHFGEPVPINDLREARKHLSEVLKSKPPEPNPNATIKAQAKRLQNMYRAVLSDSL